MLKEAKPFIDKLRFNETTGVFKRYNQMKTKFDAILKAQKQKLSICEMKIAKTNAKALALQSAIDAMVAEAAQIEIPQSADFGTLLQIRAMKKSQINDIQSQQIQLAVLKQEVRTLKQEYKHIYMEFEKIKYLQEKEQEHILKALKQKEQKMLDEMGTLLYTKENL